MFEGYKVDFGKVNWNWCHSFNIQMDEIEELLAASDRSSWYIKEDGSYEVVGYTKHRKFLSVTFMLKDDHLVIEDVNLPSYETIRDVILRQLESGQ
ncbi:hypothetical protein ACW9KT_00100 [Hymenobacter sp. HD11105]